MIQTFRGGPTLRRFAPAIGLVGLGLLLAAGRPMASRELPWWAAAGILYGVLCWLVLGYLADDEDRLPAVEPGFRPPRLLPLLAVLPLGFVTWSQTGGNRFRTVGVLCWIGAVAGWVWAWWTQETSKVQGPGSKVRPDSNVGGSVLAVLLLVMGLAAFLYFHRLGETPGEPTSDHAETLLDLTDLLHGERPIFFVRNTGREPWKFYWLFALVKVFGLSPDFFTTKVGTVTTALFAIPAMFLLGRELGGDRLGLFAAALLAWSKWPLAMARLGIRVSYAVLPTAMVLWALLRYLRRGDRGSALWAGLWIGIGLYGYIPFRIVPLLVPVVAAFAMVDPRWKGRRRRLLLDGPLIGATAALVFLPLLHFMREYPQFFWERMAERGNLAHAFGREALATLAQNLRNMALAFHVRGDGGWVNFVTRDPFLDVVTGALFLAGVALALSRIFRGSIRWLVPVAGVFILTLPSVLILTFAHENPSVNRSVAAIPVVFLLAAAPLDRLVGWLQPLRREVRIAGFLAIAALLAFSLRESYRTYFVDYDRQYSRAVEHTVEMAREIRSAGARGIPSSNAYVVNTAYWIDPRNIGYELGDPEWAATQEIPPGKPPPRLSRRPLLFLFSPTDQERRTALRRLYPDGEERLVAQREADRNFSIYLVR
ncbi:MAG TPA: hypothetical protein VGS98_15575 [Thermoanaerobaculia bacterium]|nr:hypothetical protein [Thermoanaerobaculia bacterium]